MICNRVRLQGEQLIISLPLAQCILAAHPDLPAMHPALFCLRLS